ncbi:hypothetical protein [Rhizobium straminoryzae]|uniref:Alpha/beta hydrolase n=1 Tax=Rhizobium straminoryzae TaxID=1387186 RepID=A0A549SRM8_9HYPH|nr:hypothetical protein [Rhizobium straminoryzae]TRL32274.1 hypothetical protein FNA46_23715 [Rhizobium straminoryzae]
METVYVLPGSPDVRRAVIAFAGIQSILGGIEVWEFAKTLTSDENVEEARRHVAFVRERPALWYNSVDPACLAPFLAMQDGRAVVTLGNSMGGFAAILFSLVLPGIRRSIAFCPQYSVHPDHCPWERRWQDQIAEIDNWRFETCLPHGPCPEAQDLDHMIFCGSDVGDDVRHAEAILAGATHPVSVFLIHGCGHDVARSLKRREALVPVLDLLIDDLAPPQHVAAELARRGIAFDLLSS